MALVLEGFPQAYKPSFYFGRTEREAEEAARKEHPTGGIYMAGINVDIARHASSPLWGSLACRLGEK